MPLRIVYLNPLREPGDASPGTLLERHLTMSGWCSALARAGAHVTAFQLLGRDDEVTSEGVVYRFIRAREGAAAYLSLPRFLAAAAAVRPDVVHTGGIPLPGFAPFRRRLASPVVWQHHGGGFPRPAARPLWRSGFRGIDALFFTAREQADEWRPLCGALPVVEIPEGSTSMTPLPYAAARQSLGIGAEELLLSVGRLDANKDPLTVIRGAALAHRRRPLLLAIAYGTDGLLPDARRVAEEERLPVRFLGRLPQGELRRWYSAADAFVLGSRREGSGYALIEAMACGAAPVVTGISPFRRLAGTLGAFWTPGDAFSLAAALAGPGRPSRESVVARFARELSWDAVARAALTAYASLRERRSR